MKHRTQVIYRRQGGAYGCSRGGRIAPYTADMQSRIKCDVRKECFGVPRGSSRSGPTLTRLVNGVRLASASRSLRPRIGLLDRVTCTSTRGGSS